jgi:shikimate 5-dehydrogenase
MLGKIVTPETVVLEMNYFPYMTQFLKMGKACNLRVISGTEMLIHQALASFNFYTGKTLEKRDVFKLIDKVNNYSILKENELHGRSIVGS